MGEGVCPPIEGFLPRNGSGLKVRDIQLTCASKSATCITLFSQLVSSERQVLLEKVEDRGTLSQG
jgi:hypothetical protein